MKLALAFKAMVVVLDGPTGSRPGPKHSQSWASPRRSARPFQVTQSFRYHLSAERSSSVLPLKRQLVFLSCMGLTVVENEVRPGISVTLLDQHVSDGEHGEREGGQVYKTILNVL